MKYLLEIDDDGKATIDPELYKLMIDYARTRLKGTRGISCKTSRGKKKVFKKIFATMVRDYVEQYNEL